MNSLRATRYRELFDKEEAAKKYEAEKPLRDLANRNAQLERDIEEQERLIAVRELFSKPSDALKSCTEYDHSRNLTVDQVMTATGEAVSALKTFLEDKQGVRVEKSGLVKLGKIVEVNGEIDVTSVTNLQKIWALMEKLGALNQSDFTVVRQPVIPAASVPEPVLDPEELVNVSVGGRQQQMKRREVTERKDVDKKFWGAAQPLYLEWIASLNQHWGFVPTEQQRSDALRLIETLNLDPTRRESYDKVRRAAIKHGILPETLVTAEELLNEELERFTQFNPTATPREERAWILKRSRELGIAQ